MKNIKSIVLIILISIVSLATAQTFNGSWQWANGISSVWNTSSYDWNNKQNMTIDERGNVYTLSYVNYWNLKLKPFNAPRIDTIGQSSRDLILSKYNCNGDLVWWKFVASKYHTNDGSISNAGVEYLNGNGPTQGEIICDKQGNLFFSFLGGYNMDTMIILDSLYWNNPLYFNQYYIHADTNGVLKNVFQSLKSDSTTQSMVGMSLSDNGNIYGVGLYANYVASIPTYRNVIYKMNRQTFEFDVIHQFPELNGQYGFRVLDIVIDHEENIIIAGHVSDSLSIYGEDFYMDNIPYGYERLKVAFIAKFDSLGNNIWFQRAYQDTPNPIYIPSSDVLENSLCIDDSNNVYTTLFGTRTYMNGVFSSPDTSNFTADACVIKLDGLTGIAEWILYSESVGWSNNWNPIVPHYKNGILYVGGDHGTARIDTTVFDATAGAFDPLLVAINPNTGELLEWLKIPTGGGTFSFIHDIESDPIGNLYLGIQQNGPIELTGLDTLNEIHGSRPTGLIAKYGEAACTCTAPTLQVQLNTVDTVNQQVQLSASATNQTGLTWNFGDGTVWQDTSISNVSYTYANDTMYQICVTAHSANCGTATQCLTVNLYLEEDSIIDTTAIREINSTNWGISIYPNPAKEYVNISFSGDMLAGDKEIALYSIAGVLQAKATVKEKEAISIIDLSGMAKGVYIINVSNTVHQFVGKLVIK